MPTLWSCYFQLSEPMFLLLCELVACSGIKSNPTPDWDPDYVHEHLFGNARTWSKFSIEPQECESSYIAGYGVYSSWQSRDAATSASGWTALNGSWKASISTSMNMIVWFSKRALSVKDVFIHPLWCQDSTPLFSSYMTGTLTDCTFWAPNLLTQSSSLWICKTTQYSHKRMGWRHVLDQDRGTRNIWLRNSDSQPCKSTSIGCIWQTPCSCGVL